MINKSLSFDEVTVIKRAYFETVIEHETKIYWGNANKEVKHELNTNLKIAENALIKTGMDSPHIRTIERLAKQEAERRRRISESDRHVSGYGDLLRDINEWNLMGR